MSDSAKQSVRVGIIGAGFAGLRCADVLLQRGVKVTIFEARDRIGGRVAQSNALGHVVDLGPNWIHGTDDNPIMKLAQQTGTQLHSWDEEHQAVFDAEGLEVDPVEAAEFTRLIWDDGLVAAAFKYSNEHGSEIPASTSLYDFFVERAAKLFTDLDAEAASRKRERFLQTASMWGAYVGSATHKQSLRFFWLEECIEGENPFVAGTYTKILEAVTTPVLKGAEIRLRTRVTGVHSRVGEGTQNPVIETASGERYEFDEVVVTSPLGWLKRNNDMFHPALTPRLAQAIDNIGYGTLDKVYFTFPAAFWHDSKSLLPNSDTAVNGEVSMANGLDPKHTTPNLHVPTLPLHQPTKPPSSSPSFPGFVHYLPPTYASAANPQSWDLQALNMAALPPPTAHPTLLFYIYGDCASHIAKLSTTLDPPALQKALIDFFTPYIALLPNYNSESPSCKPVAALATAWAADELAGYGSYSNFQVGLEEGDKDIEVMRTGMPERGVWFAGEHTAPFVALGTSTGAYWAGEGVGEGIVARYGLDSVAKKDESES
ncbi:hypothetical protein B0A48_04370 [Cryoendolithus antarcticus]|uniref:Amine oxidase domain-containing protein n=1 Tax=Cryoendolithus antarcticus TaxID=1507870 RepID=A0A1V8TF65_9PEZI|nr:hypothetical protein B0A48_04370 [Cryoendolithus antarcticus]